MAENIEFNLNVKKDGLSEALDKNTNKAKSLGTALQVAVGSFAASAAIKGISLLSDGVGTLVNFLEDSVKASAESETSLKQLTVALAQTGKLTDENVKSFQALATQIQATTAFEDDAVVSSIALIQSLARLDTDGLKRATVAATNLAATFNIDLDTAARLVGKAAEGNTTAFGKLGIQFEKGTTNAETFSNVLQTLESRFGGSAAAQAQTYSGALTQLTNVYGDLKENVGAIVSQSPVVIAAFNTLKSVVISLSNSVTDSFGTGNSDQVADFFRLTLDGINAIVLSADAVLRAFDIVASSVIASVRLMALGIVTPIAGILELTAAIPGIGDAFKGAADAATAEMNRLSGAFDENIKSINDSISGETTLSKLSLGIAEARNNFDLFYDDVKNKAPDLKNNLAIQPKIEDPEAANRLIALNNSLLDAENQFYLSKNQLELDYEIAEQERFAARSASQIEQLTSFELTKSELTYQAAVKSNKQLKTADEIRIADAKAAKDKEIRDLAISNKGKKDLLAQELSDRDAFLSSAASLQTSSNKSLAAIGKSAALVQIGINTQKSASASFAFGSSIGGPALGAAFAAIAVAAGTAQAAKVAGIQGFANGGIIGATQGPDNQLATVRTGEMVLNADQQGKLFSAINNGSFGGGEIVIQIDGRTIATAMRDQAKQGFKF
jgi:hypothetical protein